MKSTTWWNKISYGLPQNSVENITLGGNLRDSKLAIKYSENHSGYRPLETKKLLSFMINTKGLSLLRA